MRLAYFPSIYSDEILYSVLARYGRHTGNQSPSHIMESLFGNRHVIASLDIHGSLDELSRRIPEERRLSPEYIINNLTLFPYYTAFVPGDIRTYAKIVMATGDIKDLHIQLGMVAFRMGKTEIPKYCPECLAEMMDKYGELYWKRTHQLPGVYMCSIHMRLLSESKIQPEEFRRHSYIPALDKYCPSIAKPIFTKVSDKQLEILSKLEHKSEELLELPNNARTFERWTQYYRRRMIDVGLTKSMSVMNQQKLHTEFREYYGDLLHKIPGVMDKDSFAGDWLAGMVRKHRKIRHPLEHIMLQVFLDSKSEVKQPFGTGPWQCRNPLANHREKFPIKSINTHTNHGNLVGVFKCKCGYIYTQCYHPNIDKYDPPKFYEYGPLLKPELERLLSDNQSLRGIGRRLRLDPKTVIRLAHELNLDIPWDKSTYINKTKKVENKNTRHVVETVVQKSNRKAGKRPLKDWSSIDLEYQKHIHETVKEILTELPPIRVTIAQIERRLKSPGWFMKRKNKLPLTTKMIYQKIESLESFQVRRIYWAIDEIKASDDSLKPWKVMRKAGLRSNSLEMIQKIIETPNNICLVA